MANRLNLNFQLSNSDERSTFVNKYVQRQEFIDKPLTEEELETIANYLLYGRDPATGKNSVQDKTVQIATKHGNWESTVNHETESLDALIEQPTFNEASVHTNLTHFTHRNEKFSRSAALNISSPEQSQQFLELFQRIDTLDYKINLYELRHSKRTSIREQLTSKFSPEETSSLTEEITHWSSYTYLKQRHQLVELRREQYTLRDSITNPILSHNTAPAVYVPSNLDWDNEIQVLPLGLINTNSSLIFRNAEELRPDRYSDEELAAVSHYYWQKKEPNSDICYTFNFADLESVYQLFLVFWELDSETQNQSVEGNLRGLLDTLNYYIDLADLSDIHSEILTMKMKKVKNQDIADYINNKYNKNYTDNYISTIFRQKIIPQINTAATAHEKIISNIFFPEEFKTCSCCGRAYLRSTDYFVKKSRSSDGLNSRCKKCDKREREEKKVIKNG